MSHKNNKTSKKSPTKKHIESFNNDDNTTFEYIIKHKSKYNIHDIESDSESETEYIVKNKSNHCNYKSDCNYKKESKYIIKNKSKQCDEESDSDTEYIIENKSKHCKYSEEISNFDPELFEYFFKANKMNVSETTIDQLAMLTSSGKSTADIEKTLTNSTNLSNKQKSSVLSFFSFVIKIPTTNKTNKKDTYWMDADENDM